MQTLPRKHTDFGALSMLEVVRQKTLTVFEQSLKLYHVKTDCKGLTAEVQSGIEDAAQAVMRAIGDMGSSHARPDTHNFWIPLAVIRQALSRLVKPGDGVSTKVR